MATKSKHHNEHQFAFSDSEAQLYSQASLTDLWMEHTLRHDTWITWAGRTSWTCFPPFQRQDVLPYWSPQNAAHMLTDTHLAIYNNVMSY